MTKPVNKYSSILALSLVSLLVYGSVGYAGIGDELAEEVTRVAKEKAAKEAADKKKAEAAAVAAAEEKKREAAKKEATRKANAALAEAKQKCDDKGGDWKKGKCVMPPPPKQPAPKPDPTPEPTPEPVAVVEPHAPRPAAENSQIIKPEMRPIPAGKFTMGCVDGRDNVEGVATCGGDETPAHEVTLNAFQIAKTETTVAQYMACVDAGACPPPAWKEANASDYYKSLGAGLSGSDYPIVGVSWDNANAYAKWLSQETGNSYRLPTEAEWEYAARGGADTAYPWGNAIGKGNANCGSECGDKFEYTAPVGSFTANGYGLSDMNGNVWEWCQDWYASDYYASSPASNPKGAASGTARVLRGGSWFILAQLVRSARRSYSTQDGRYSNIGFRLVLP
jgi:formylglycine-generating enzyme required for sulfatase activity